MLRRLSRSCGKRSSMRAGRHPAEEFFLDTVHLHSMTVDMPTAPTERQKEIAEFLSAEFERRGMMPTEREIAARFRFSSRNSVRSHLRLMEKKGMLARQPYTARGLQLAIGAAFGIPLLGDIVAGDPELAIENAKHTVPIASEFFGVSRLFALRVKGDSMKDAGILPGDIAVLRRQEDVDNGEIAAVLIEDEATLKFLYRRRGTLVLRGANATFSDIMIRSGEERAIRVLGKYVGLIRKKGTA
jgi:repressor LexA